MNTKIEWYRELLEQEPASRAFLPLAKLLIEEDENEEAIVTLHKGIARHPDFLEAKLQLLTLLYQKNKETDECAKEISGIVKLLKNYPAFWDAWAELEKNSDATLAIRFLRQTIVKPTLSLRDILLRGLGAPSSPESEKEQVTEKTAPIEVIPEVLPAPTIQNTDQSDAITANATRLASVVEKSVLDKVEVISPNANQENVSLRTRSMAEILAEQGDISGALEIYQELEAAAPTAEEAAVLKDRVMALAAQIGQQNEETDSEMTESEEDIDEPPIKDAPVSQKKMLDILEQLAERLEARAQV